MMKYLDQFGAEKDTIVKFNAVFISMYLGIKACNQLVLLLHYEGNLLQYHFNLSIVMFFNNLATICFYIACSLNFYKW